MANEWNDSVREQAVTRLLRRKDTSHGNGWTDDPARAQVFSDALEAATTCGRFKLTNMELALRVEPGACDVFCTTMCWRSDFPKPGNHLIRLRPRPGKP